MTMEIHSYQTRSRLRQEPERSGGSRKVDIPKPLEDVRARDIHLLPKCATMAADITTMNCSGTDATENPGNAPAGSLLAALNKSLWFFDAFKKQFSDAGKNRFWQAAGPGYT